MIAYRPLDVPPDLRPYVRRIVHADHEAPITAEVRPAPTGYSYIGWVYRGTVGAKDATPPNAKLQDGPHVAGQITSDDITVRYDGRLGHLLAECTATGLTELTGIAGADCVNQASSLRHLAPFAALDAPYIDPPAQRFVAALSGQAAAPFSVPGWIKEAATLIEQAGGQIKITDLAGSLAVSQRQLERGFKNVVGLSPKFFARVQQLNLAFTAMQQDDTATLAALAVEAGFYDQAHFNNAMRAFLGTSPLAYLRSPDDLFSTFLGRSDAFRALVQKQAAP